MHDPFRVDVFQPLQYTQHNQLNGFQIKLIVLLDPSIKAASLKILHYDIDRVLCLMDLVKSDRVVA